MLDKENIFGFSTAPGSSADFVPIVKYDAKAGRMFRIDRDAPEPADITGNFAAGNAFKCIADFENLEAGWILFVAGTAPDFRLVKWGTRMPPQPSPNHQNGMRFMLKLSTEHADNHPAVREIAGTAKAMLRGFGAAYVQYLEEKDKNPNKLPVLVLEKTRPIKSGSGVTSSTNYDPVFQIVGWVARPADLVFVPKAQPALAEPNKPTHTAAPNTAPSTGSTRAAPPPQQSATEQVKQMVDLADDFG